jgi:hypothetical protein
MEKVKKNKQDSLIMSVVVTCALMAFMGGYIISGSLTKSLSKAKNNETVKEEDTGFDLAGYEIETGTFGFDKDAIDSKDASKDYNIILGTYVGNGEMYLGLSFGTTNQDVIVSEYSYSSDQVLNYTISFNKEVVDYHIGTYEEGISDDVLYFLLSDGTVKMLKIENAMVYHDYQAYTELPVNNVVKFYDASICDKTNGQCNNTTFAQKSNGQLFDLEYLR